MPAHTAKLRVIIIGSGLAGLAAARVIREKHDVIIYEQAGPDAATGGQGISLSPNSVQILDSIGFDRDRAGAVVSSGYRSFDKDGQMRLDMEIDFVARYGADLLTFKRSDFRDELFRLATAPPDELGAKFYPVKTVFNNGAVDLNPEAGTVTLRDGSMDKADCIIVADGIHSTLRKRIVGNNNYIAKKMGATCFRVALSSDKVKEILGELPFWWDPTTNKNRPCMIEARDGSHRFIAAYALRSSQYMNLSAVFPTREDRASTVDSWYAEADRSEVLEVFQDFHEPIRKMLSVADELKMWDLQDIDPLPTWTNGRAILIGDAAHAMTPMQGQGANMSVEDGESFRLLTSLTSHEDVPGILQQIDSIRRPRATQVLNDTRAISDKMSLEEVTAKMDFNMKYKGILDALKQAQTLGDS